MKQDIAQKSWSDPEFVVNATAFLVRGRRGCVCSLISVFPACVPAAQASPTAKAEQQAEEPVAISVQLGRMDAKMQPSSPPGFTPQYGGSSTARHLQNRHLARSNSGSNTPSRRSSVGSPPQVTFVGPPDASADIALLWSRCNWLGALVRSTRVVRKKFAGYLSSYVPL